LQATIFSKILGEKLIKDYNLLKGRIWVFVLIAIATAPYIIAKLLGK